jgi:hypothetical protein
MSGGRTIPQVELAQKKSPRGDVVIRPYCQGAPLVVVHPFLPGPVGQFQ